MIHENKRTKHHAIGEQVSGKQQIIHEIVNPEVDERRNKAISKSPKIRREDLVTDEMFPRTWIQFEKGADKTERLRKFKENYGYVPIGLKMKPLKTK